MKTNLDCAALKDKSNLEQSDNIYKSHRHVLVVSLFIIAASLLVVLTTFAVNMLTSTGDFNRLLVQYSQQNSDRDELLIQYLESGNTSFKEAYKDSLNYGQNTDDVIDELLAEDPNADIIFEEFHISQIHPNEITGLIRIFTLFSEQPEIRKLKQNWFRIQQLNTEKRAIADSLINIEYSKAKMAAKVSGFHRMNREINNHIRGMIEGNSAILLLLKRYSLWFTVLLGILIVLIGIIFTVRGVKQIDKLQKVLHERDYLALFPELNQYPVLNITTDGELGFVNQATHNLFTDLKIMGIDHPFLKEIRAELPRLKKNKGGSLLKEIKVGDNYYQQAVNYLSEEKGIHVHSFDITTIKEQQLEISKSLDEKNMLLAEIHHRVKNNMAVISGLLELQEMLGDDPNTALAESRSRIKSMANVHELLYQSESIPEIDTREYLEKISRHVNLSFSQIENVEFHQSASTPKLNINQAVPLGLLINEIVLFICNQIDPADKTFELSIEIEKRAEKFCVRISALLPQVESPLTTSKKSTLSMELIKNLLEQIEGKLTIPKSDQLEIGIRFKPTDKKGSSSSYL